MAGLIAFWRKPSATLEAWLGLVSERPGVHSEGSLWRHACSVLAQGGLILAAVAAIAATLAEFPFLATLVVMGAICLGIGSLAGLRLAGVPGVLRVRRRLRLKRARALTTLALAFTAVPVLTLALALSVAGGAGLTGAVFAGLVVLAGFALLGIRRHAFLVEQAAKSSEGRAQPLPVGRFWLSVAVETLLALVLLALLVWGTSRVAFPLFQVPSGSMWPTLFGGGAEDGDVILVDRTVTWLGFQPSRYDVLVFEHPGYPDNMVKRAVAFGGERVQLQGGSVWIDGQPAPRPPEVQHAQMQREPILAFRPPGKQAGRGAQRQAQAQFERSFRLWHGGPLREALPSELAERTRLVAPALHEKASTLAEVHWREPSAGLVLLEERERSLWQLAQPADLAEGIVLGYLDGHGEIASRLVVRESMQDPALEHMRVHTPAGHLGVDLSLEPLAEAAGEASGRIRVGVRAESEKEVLEHRFDLDLRASPKPVALGGRVRRFDSAGGHEERTIAAEALDSSRNGSLQLRLHTVDGRWEAWANGKRHQGKRSGAATLALSAMPRDVVVWVESEVPVRLTEMQITAATAYLPTGPLRKPLEVPPGKLVFLGDNTHASSDSREWEMLGFRWPDGRSERLAVYEDDGSMATKASAEVPRDEVPAVLLEQEWPEQVPKPLSLLSWRLDRGGQRLAREEVVVYWHEHRMRAEEEAYLRGLSEAPAWQEAIDELKRQAGTLPVALGLQPAPFVAEANLVGRVVGVLSPARRVHRIR